MFDLSGGGAKANYSSRAMAMAKVLAGSTAFPSIGFRLLAKSGKDRRSFTIEIGLAGNQPACLNTGWIESVRCNPGGNELRFLPNSYSDAFSSFSGGVSPQFSQTPNKV